MTSFFNVERFSDKKFFFRVQKFGWKFIGFWPGSDDVSTFRKVLAVVHVVLVLSYAIFQFYFCYENRANLVVLLDALTPLTTQMTSTIKVLVIFSRRKAIKEILDHLRNSFYFDRSPESIKIHARVCRISFLFSFILCMFVNSTQLSFWLVPLIKDLFCIIQGVPRSYGLPLKSS